MGLGEISIIWLGNANGKEQESLSLEPIPISFSDRGMGTGESAGPSKKHSPVIHSPVSNYLCQTEGIEGHPAGITNRFSFGSVSANQSSIRFTTLGYWADSS